MNNVFAMSKIEWTEETWNPLIGCSKVSPGCKNCYAIQTAWIRQHNPKMAERYSGVVEKTLGGSLNWTGRVNFVDGVLDKPLKKKKPTMYFVNSMSDLFHESVPFDAIDKVFAVMGRCQHHTFQILTKRPERMLEYYKSDPYQRILNASYQLPLPKWLSIGTGIDNPNTNGNWGWKHVWMGVSVENQQTANERIPLLLQVPAAVRFLSCEPLLGPVDLTQVTQTISPGYFGDCLQPYHVPYCDKEKHYPVISWVIVGGESGKDARPVHPDWVRSLRDQCQKAGVSYFFKQWGAFVDVNNILPVPMEDFSKNLKNGKWVSVDNTGAIVKHVSGPNNAIIMAKGGKKSSGRQLDGREWNEFPGKQLVAGDDPDLYVGGFG
jgi:protein gp37